MPKDVRMPLVEGFSLIEMMGVIAVGLILVLALAWVTVKSIDQALGNHEGALLQTFAASLQNSILRNGYVPGTADWYQVIATEAGMNTNAVLQTARNTSRVFMVDPNFRIGTNSTGVLPYTQTTDGSTNQPQNARVIILSSLSVALPASGTSSTNFTALWNTTDGYLPTNSSFSGWKGRSDDLKIQRINLGPLFVHLQLANYLSGANQGRYKIAGQGPATVTTNGLNAYFLENTVLTLLPDTNSVTTNAQAELMLSRDLSFFYVAQVWRDVPYIPDYFTAAQTNAAAANLANMVTIAANMFVSSPNNTNALYGTTPTKALNSMSNFMYYYATYYGPSAASNGWTSPGNAYEPTAKSWQTAVQTNMNNLFQNIVQGGCTNGP
jgi:type II secretory pathway pseudopilin PulG